MIKELTKKPNYYLTLRVCIESFNRFKKKLRFDQPIPPLKQYNIDKLDSILKSIEQTFAEEYLNKTVLDVASAYLNQFVRGHAFLNENKRMACLFTHFFLLANGVDLTLSFKGFYNFALIVALLSKKGYSSEKTKKYCHNVIQKFAVKRIPKN